MSEKEFVGVAGPVVRPRMVTTSVGITQARGNLPPPPAPVVNRTAELATLSGLAGPRPLVVGGAAGVGKTSLVLHWAERQTHRFPDGRFYFRSARLPLRRLLVQLGADHAAVPEGLDAQLALLRRATELQRILVVLDEIEDPVPVRELLDGVLGLTVLIISRTEVDAALVLPPTALPSSVEEAWQGLTEAGREALYLIAHLPGTDLGEETFRALTGDPSSDRAAELVRAGVLERHGGRLRIPSAVRHHLPPLDQAMGVEHYLRHALAAGQKLSPHRPLPRHWDRKIGFFTDAAAALAWLDEEHHNLLAAQRRCLELHRHTEAWRLAWALETYHRRRGLLGDLATQWQAALVSAALTRDTAGQLLARQVLADLDNPVERTPEAATLEGIAAVHAELGDYTAAKLNWDRVQDLCRGPATEVTVYTTSDNGEALCQAVAELLQVAGFELAGAEPPVRGSWFQRFRVRGDSKAVDKLGELAGKLERAAELKYIATPRSENDEREASAIAKLAEAMKEVDEVVIRTSSVLFVKTGGCVMSIVLSEDQIRCLDRNPQLMRAPGQVLDALAELVRAEPVPLAVEGQTG
ncbi:hypothetical protein M8C13_01740 [Crossiella sp. SN42]|uniref:hypothetical protein n=1 Tax=Crossiella sp. SN42 TaxID=2944808 RepID=UPI00207CC3CD|nr:hypothetical protein [Crossiella sp. SN42]MCO1574479.1 hypothetical protein [Crossiella sp. SN42]